MLRGAIAGLALGLTVAACQGKTDEADPAPAPSSAVRSPPAMAKPAHKRTVAIQDPFTGAGRSVAVMTSQGLSRVSLS